MIKQQRKKIRNPIVQQYLIELVLPFAGYFFFDWSIMFIGFYYLIDQIVGQILFYRRYLWVSNRGKVKHIPIIFYTILIPYFIVILGVEVYAFQGVMAAVKNVEWSAIVDQFLTFSAEELWLLLPVMLFAYHVMDQFSFYAPRRYLNYTGKQYGFLNLLQNTLILALTIIVALITIQFKLNDTWLLIIFVVLKIGFDLLSHQVLTKRIQKTT
ncbi:MAG: DUF6498-containing protein [Crocinitomicaceae bacterium]